MLSFSIRSSTIRLGIFISSLAIATIMVFQLVWLKKVYNFEQKEFNHSIVKSIRGMYEDLDVNSYNYSHLNELIENPEPDLYVARLALPVDTDSLTSYLLYELEDFGVFTDCHLGIFSAAEGKYIYTGVLKSAGVKHQSQAVLPPSQRLYDHIALFFPNRKQYILAQMNFWIITSALLLIVLLLFGASIYYFYKQKFLNETQKDFIHNFTHEFKTPVAVISLAADVLKNPSIASRPEKLATYAGIVEYQSAYLRNQIEKLLKFAYTDSSQFHLSKEKVNLHDLVHEAISNLQPLIKEKNVELDLQLMATHPILMADRDYLIIVIMNLVDNAIKYSKTPRITITSRSAQHSIIMGVQDNGIGIDKKEFETIFQKFFRVRRGEAYAAKGFGIGLSFVKKIVDAHKGKIHVTSEPASGSNFIIELPVQ